MVWAPLLVVLILSLSSCEGQQPVPLELLKAPNARCLDGTQGGFYHQVLRVDQDLVLRVGCRLDGTQGGFYHQVVDRGFRIWGFGFSAGWMEGRETSTTM